jgi:hypothetical protein
VTTNVQAMRPKPRLKLRPKLRLKLRPKLQMSAAARAREA